MFNESNFFTETIGIFQNAKKPERKPDFTSYKKFRYEDDSVEYLDEISSKYWYTPIGVYRESNHWGAVASCRWAFDPRGEEYLDIQNWDRCWYYLTYEVERKGKPVTGFCRWEDFSSMEKYLSNYKNLSLDGTLGCPPIKWWDRETKNRDLDVFRMPANYEYALRKCWDYKHKDTPKQIVSESLSDLNSSILYMVKTRLGNDFRAWLARGDKNIHSQFYKSCIYYRVSTEKEREQGYPDYTVEEQNILKEMKDHKELESSVEYKFIEFRNFADTRSREEIHECKVAVKELFKDLDETFFEAEEIV